MFKINNKDSRTRHVNDVVLMSLLLTLNKFHTFSKYFYRCFWTSKEPIAKPLKKQIWTAKVMYISYLFKEFQFD